MIVMTPSELEALIEKKIREYDESEYDYDFSQFSVEEIEEVIDHIAVGQSSTRGSRFLKGLLHLYDGLDGVDPNMGKMKLQTSTRKLLKIFDEEVDLDLGDFDKEELGVFLATRSKTITRKEFISRGFTILGGLCGASFILGGVVNAADEHKLAQKKEDNAGDLTQLNREYIAPLTEVGIGAVIIYDSVKEWKRTTRERLETELKYVSDMVDKLGDRMEYKTSQRKHDLRR